MCLNDLHWIRSLAHEAAATAAAEVRVCVSPWGKHPICNWNGFMKLAMQSRILWGNCYRELCNYNRVNDVCGRVCGNRLPKRLLSPSPKSQVMFASVFSWIGDFFRIFGISLIVHFVIHAWNLVSATKPHENVFQDGTRTRFGLWGRWQPFSKWPTWIVNVLYLGE